MTSYPSGYGTDLVPLDELRRIHTASGDGFGMEPTYEGRLFAWIESQGGLIGIGDGWRPYGDDVSDASSSNKSFHQTQRFWDGTQWFCAVDLVAQDPGTVHRSPTWAEVPEQGSAAAASWGVHANVGGEPWHLQPVELDGFDSWDAMGRPRPGDLNDDDGDEDWEVTMARFRMVSDGYPEALVAIDGAGTSMIGFASEADRDAILAALGPVGVAVVSGAQYLEVQRVAAAGDSS